MKKLLKKIFPIVLLKKAFIIYNHIKIKTFDKIAFPEYTPSTEELLLYQKLYPFKENKISISDLNDERIFDFMNQWYDWTQEEFIVKIQKKSVIEPDYGWNIIGRKLNYYSLGFSRTPFQPKPKFIKSFTQPNTITLDKVISLRDTGEENYFHFYNDVIAKIIFLKSHNFNLDEYTFIIAKKLWDKKYFKTLLKRSQLLQAIKFHVQDSEFIISNEAIFCKPNTHSKEILDQVLKELKVLPSKENKKIYLKRSKNRQRFIENDIEVEAMFQKLGFEIVDTDLISLEEQIILFSQTQWLVGIHGAGLTNIIFRTGNKMSLLEIFPPPEHDYLPFHYIMLSKMYNFRYQAIIGERSSKKFSSGFYVNPQKLEKAVIVLLDLNGKKKDFNAYS